MKRVLFVTMPLALALALVVAGVAALVGIPVAARRALDRYIQWIEPTAVSEAMVRAGRPWNLDPAWRYPVLGDSLVFRTDHTYEPANTPTLVPAGYGTITYTVPIMPAGEPVALPFPPEEVWCVALHKRSAAADSAGPERVLLIARHHEEPHLTEWVVHQGPAAPFSDDVMRSLSALSCEKALDR